MEQKYTNLNCAKITNILKIFPLSVSFCSVLEHYQGQQVKEEAGVLADQIVCLTAQVHKELESACGSLTSIDDISHIGGQDKRCSVPEGEKSEQKYWATGLSLN